MVDLKTGSQIILDDKINARDKQRNDFRPIASSKKALIPPRLTSPELRYQQQKASKHQSAPSAPLFHSFGNNLFTKGHVEEYSYHNDQRPASMPVTYPPVARISQKVPKRLSVPSTNSIQVKEHESFNENTINNNIENNNNSNIENNNNNDNNNNNNNNNYPYLNLNATATKSVPSLALVRDILITPAPSTPTLKKLQFSSTILEHETWTREDYDRRGDQTTCNNLTPSLAQRIKQELNQFKMIEMQVHEESKKNTHYFA
ncbi:hypothetical protein Glove_14g29 [Diversispora epigaea]|uniref:Uncharacterized protein n=1 Tax=Diversispora epigaea TaxID=1348612 RepID=A0A397JW35_9GLOM|nr:hypothetical protein Glove_14g29 [Diversispora epigaea]